MAVRLFGERALLMNTPGHFLEEITGIMPLSTTIFAPATGVFVVGFLVLMFVAARLLLPRETSLYFTVHGRMSARRRRTGRPPKNSTPPWAPP